MMGTWRTSGATEHREWGNVDALLIWLSGASPRILRQCPTERPKYTGIGSIIFVTSLIAAISMGFLLHEDVGATLGWAAAFSILWGLAIAALDRWLTVSLDRQPAPLRYLFLALPRIALGILIGVVITVPLTMQIFRSDIDAQIAIDQQEEANAFFTSLSASPLSKKTAADQKSVTSLEEVINSDGAVPLNISKDPIVANLTLQRDQAQQQASNAYRAWQQQLYGTGPGSVAGNGPLAEVNHANYLSLTHQVSSLDSQIQDRERVVEEQANRAGATRLSQAQRETPAAQARLAADRAELNSLTVNGQQAINNNTGLLAHLQAFSQETSRSQVLSSAAFTIFMLFLLIQLLPIVVKVLLNLGSQNTYEKMVAYEEESWLRAAREDVARRQAKRSLE